MLEDTLMQFDHDFWAAVDSLVSSSEIVIDMLKEMLVRQDA